MAHLRGEHGDGCLSYALADPRWNRVGFADLRLRLLGVAAGRHITATLRGTDGSRRPQWQGVVTVGVDGTVVIDRGTVALPETVPWSAVHRLSLDGLGNKHFSVVGLTRIADRGRAAL